MCSDTKQISLSVKHNKNNSIMRKVVSSLSLFSSAVTGQLLWRRMVSCDCIAVHQDFAAAWEKCVMISQSVRMLTIFLSVRWLLQHLCE